MSIGPEKMRWTANAVRERLNSHAPGIKSRRDAAGPVSAAREAYRRAAAVLVSFDPERLRPDGAVDAEVGPVRELMEDCALAASSDRTQPARWTLKADLRREVLRNMGGREALLRALAANPHEADATGQRMMAACIQGRLPPLEACSERELAELLDAVFVLDEALKGLPDREQLQTLLEQKRLLSPFEYLVGEHFQGRRDELDALRAFAGLIPPESMLRRLKHLADSFWNGEPSVLVIHGPGGVGKSTLLSKFLLEHTQALPGQRLPFAYLDFDNPRFSFDDPAGLLIEMTRQFAVQYPEHRAECESVRNRLQRHALEAESGQYFLKQSFVLAAFSVLVSLLARGVALPGVSPARKDWPPLFLVFDTFEEVQFRSPPHLGAVRDFLEEMGELCPGARVVISGRASLPELKVHDRPPRSLPLTELDELAALGLLGAHGIEDPELGTELMKQVGRNPLSLKLAAEVAKREGLARGPIKDLKTTRFLLFSAKETMVQGQLYQRILGHIHDPEVRKLAHPGLVLRQVTPELIREVLARPCGIHLEGPDSERVLFEALRKEVSLVSAVGPDRVKHRPDVRAVMLELLVRDRPEQVEAIHRAAVEFHARSPKVEDLAEELYHRLMLGEDLATLESRWREELKEDLREYLAGSLHEMPPSGQAFLASKLGLFLPDEVRHRADLESWEQLTAETLRKMLQMAASKGEDSPEQRRLIMTLSRMLTDEGPAILVLDGPHPSGRTFTRVHIQRLAEKRDDLRVAFLRFSYMQSISKLAQQLSLELGEAPPSAMPSPNTTTARWVRLLADWILAHDVGPRFRQWLVLDGIESSRLDFADVDLFIEALAERIATEPVRKRFRLVLLAHPRALSGELDRDLVRVTLPDAGGREHLQMMEYCMSLLRERRDRSDGSPLHPLEVEVLSSIGRFDEAESLLEEAVPMARRARDTRVLLTLLLMEARLQSFYGNHELARAHWSEAAALALKRGDAISRMSALLGLLQLPAASVPEQGLLRAELTRILADTPTSTLDRGQEVCRQVVEELGPKHPDVLIAGLRAIRRRADMNIQGLGLLLDRVFGDRREDFVGQMATRLELRLDAPATGFADVLEAASEVHRLDEALAMVVRESPRDAGVLALITHQLVRRPRGVFAA